MDLIFILILVSIITIFIVRMLPVKGIHSITTEELKEVMNEKNKQFIDVRTPGEYKANHIKPFKNIPLFHLKTAMENVDRSDDIILICQSGMRSMRAAKMLKKAGFTHITNVSNGMNGWYT